MGKSIATEEQLPFYPCCLMSDFHQGRPQKCVREAKLEKVNVDDCLTLLVAQHALLCRENDPPH